MQSNSSTLRPFLNPTVIRQQDREDSFPSFRNKRVECEADINPYYRLTPQRERRDRLYEQSSYSPSRQDLTNGSLSPLSYTVSNIQQSEERRRVPQEVSRRYIYEEQGRSPDRREESFRLVGGSGGFSSEYVADLRKLHERELEEFQIRYRNAERNHARVKESLLGQLESLKRQLEGNYKKHSDQLQQLTEDNAQEMKRIIHQKDQIINDLQRKNLELTAELNEEGARCSQARQESLTLKVLKLQGQLSNGQTIKQLEAESRARAETIDFLRNDHRHSVDELNARFIEEKKSLKQEYEMLIDSLQANSSRRIDELRDVISDRNQEIESLNSQLREIRGSFNSRLEQLNHELETLQESAKACKYWSLLAKRLQDVQLMENKNLKEENAANLREIKLLSSEMNLLDGEKDRLRNENEDLKGGLAKLERLVYGKKKPQTSAKKGGRF